MQSQSAQTPQPQPQRKVTVREAFPPRVLAPMMVKVALVNAAMLVGAILLGRFLDGLTHSRIVFTVILAVVGLQAALFITYKIGSRAAAGLDKADAEARAANVVPAESLTTASITDNQSSQQ